jgi:UDP-N-acetylglucosamine 2-epimerase (non-hydrolysing)
MSLVKQAKLTITDSGGIQEETTYLNIPCLTIREKTERPITITQGTNQLSRFETLHFDVKKILRGEWRSGVRPDLWDGLTAERVVKSLKSFLGI